jgi:hypothetical protein
LPRCHNGGVIALNEYLPAFYEGDLRFFASGIAAGAAGYQIPDANLRRIEVQGKNHAVQVPVTAGMRYSFEPAHDNDITPGKYLSALIHIAENND